MRINEGIIPRPLSLYNPKSVAATVTRTRLRTNITEEELSRKLEEELWVKFNTDPRKEGCNMGITAVSQLFLLLSPASLFPLALGRLMRSLADLENPTLL